MKSIITNLLCHLILVALAVSSASSQGQQNETGKVIMCYWGTWAFWKLSHPSFPEYSQEGNFNNEQINPFLCTHLIYSFAGLHITSSKINTLDPEVDLEAGDVEPNPNVPDVNRGVHGMLKKATLLRDGPDQNPNLKVLIAIGGWGQESKRFSDVVRSVDLRTIFIGSIIEFIVKHNLDGVDMDWEYPADRGGNETDKANFPIFLQELKAKLNEKSVELRRPLILTSAFGCGKDTVDKAYNVAEISKHIDYFNLMLYDFKLYLNGSNEETKKIGHHSPLFYKEDESEADKTLSVQWAVDYFIELGAPREKLVLGVGAYGRTYKLEERSAHNFYDTAAGPGSMFAFSQQEGIMTYYEICLEIKKNVDQWEFHFDNDYKIPYTFKWIDNDTNKWIGYDDEHSVVEKVDFAIAKGLGGMMMWSIDQDDFNNYCDGWRKFPLLSAIKDRLEWHTKKKIDNKN